MNATSDTEACRARTHVPLPADNETPGLGIYVHFPWCLRKCPYCDFLSIAREPAEIPRQAYTRAVCAELTARARQLPKRRVRSVFFGGGTPSLWGASEIGQVLEVIAQHFEIAHPAPEITVECNPTSFSKSIGTDLLHAGVNRISLGLQSLNAERLRFLGRLHDVEGGLAALEAALSVGFPEVSADLIFGVAGQTASEAADEAAQIASRGVSHLSAYALTIEPGTQFGALHRKGRLPLLPDDVVADCFTQVDSVLQAAGLEHYEISNYARRGHEAQHNLGYWRGQAYLGVGCGAWGTVQLEPSPGPAPETESTGAQAASPLELPWVRYRNTPSPERYMSLQDFPPPKERDACHDSVERLEPATRLTERLMLGLRLAEGLDLAELEAELGVPVLEARRVRAIERAAQRGRVDWSAPRLRIPRSRWLLADGIIAEIA